MTQQRALLGLLLIEIVIFGFIGQNFFTGANAFEIVRLSAELGLLALSLTPVIVTGGIDLSVGSMMGLAAVVFGKLWRDFGFSIELAALAALAVGVLGGGVNALLIARWKISPLIVTLGTYSLFRGLAEGITSGLDSFTGFPAGFLYLGQGYIGGIVPPQVLILAVAAVGYDVLLRRSVIGRALYAIGFSQEGARWAGLPVRWRISLVYVLSGRASAIAAISMSRIRAGEIGCGHGYESWRLRQWCSAARRFSGAAARFGRCSDWSRWRCCARTPAGGLPAELVGILTGVLLIVTIGAEVYSLRGARRRAGERWRWVRWRLRFCWPRAACGGWRRSGAGTAGGGGITIG